jgi:sugar-specific transcriptional regulator TrmB
MTKKISMDELLQHLEVLHFSKTEASVYITLVQNGKLNGSQIAKSLHISRSSVYSALNNLYSKGVVFLLPGESNVYKARDPELLIEAMKTEYLQAADNAKSHLTTLKAAEREDEYVNIKGYQNFVIKTKEILRQAQQEVYMNTCFEPDIFAEEIRELNERGVRIVVFSFANIHPEGLPVEFYSKYGGEDVREHQRMMLVVDLKRALIAGSYQGGEVFGTFTDNPLLVSIVSEHILLDIYLLKIEQKYGKLDFLQDIQISSLVEKNFNKGRDIPC